MKLKMEDGLRRVLVDCSWDEEGLYICTKMAY